MNQATAENLLTLEEGCPFFSLSPEEGKPKCATSPRASLQLCYCETEDYDSCPLFLGRLLRNSRPKFRGALDLVHK